MPPAWPTPTGLQGDAALLDPIVEIMTLVRRAKTEAKVSQRADVATLTVSAPEALHAVIEQGRADLTDAGTIKRVRDRCAARRCRATVVLAPAT